MNLSSNVQPQINISSNNLRINQNNENTNEMKQNNQQQQKNKKQKKSKLKLKSKLKSNESNQLKQQYRCETCNIICHSEHEMEMHKKSNKHIDNSRIYTAGHNAGTQLVKQYFDFLFPDASLLIESQQQNEMKLNQLLSSNCPSQLNASLECEETRYLTCNLWKQFISAIEIGLVSHSHSTSTSTSTSISTAASTFNQLTFKECEFINGLRNAQYSDEDSEDEEEIYFEDD
jgi:hypothetical protein